MGIIVVLIPVIGLILYIIFNYCIEDQSILDKITNDETKTESQKAKIIENIQANFHQMAT